MAVKLRLRRMGKKKNPFYRVVVADSRAARNGRFIETVGTYNPLTNPYQVELNEDRIYYWLGNGAQPSDTVKNLFQKKGLWLKWDLMRNGADEAKINEEFAKWQALRDQREARIAAEKDQKAKAEKALADKAAAEAEAAAKAEEEAEAKAAEKAAKKAEKEAEKAKAEATVAEEADSKENQPEETEAAPVEPIEETKVEETTPVEPVEETKAEEAAPAEQTEEVQDKKEENKE